MRVLVTGASGLVGRHLLRRIAPHHDVIAVARGEVADAPEGVEWVRRDLTEPLDRSALPERLDVVVHLAQSQRYRDFPEGAEDLFDVNVHSTSRLLRFAREAGAERFVLASTGGVYGHSSKPITEDDPLGLSAPYFRSKRIAELLLDDYAGLITPIALRFFFVYGPGKGQTLVPRLADRILRGEKLTVDGDPGISVNPIYADDAAEAIEAAFQVRDPLVVNVAGAEAVTVTELIERLAGALGRSVEIRHTGEADGDLVADIGRMRSVLGVTPATRLEDGLRVVADSLIGATADASSPR